MNKLILFTMFFFSSYCLIAQPRFIAEGGLSLNLLNSSKEVNQTTSYTYHASMGITGKYTSSYLFATLSQIKINDKEVKENKYLGSLVGFKYGFRPFAKRNMKRIQPVIEGGYQLSFEDKEKKPLRSYGNVALGAEIYLSNKVSLVIIGSYDSFGFAQGGHVNNFSNKSFLRIVL